MSKNKSALSWGFMHPPQKYHTGPFSPNSMSARNPNPKYENGF